MISTTTGSSIESYFTWLRAELEKKDYGEVAIKFVICGGQVTDVRKESVDADHYPLQPKRR